jgi:hypothetical protein
MSRIILAVVVIAALLPVAFVVGPVVLWGPPETSDGKDGFKPGKLSQDAVVDAISFRSYPVVWLGEEFQGYQLTYFDHQRSSLAGVATPLDSVVLVYGTCERGPRENSCVPPLALTIRRSGDSLDPGGVPETVNAPFAECGPGIAAAGKETVVWREGGIVIEVQAKAELCQMVIPALRLANTETFGAN